MEDWSSAGIELRQWKGNQWLQQEWVWVFHYRRAEWGEGHWFQFLELQFLKEYKVQNALSELELVTKHKTMCRVTGGCGAVTYMYKSVNRRRRTDLKAVLNHYHPCRSV